MTQPQGDKQHIIDFAARIHWGTDGVAIGQGMINLVNAYKRDPDVFAACRKIIDAFPGSFVLHGERAAE